MKEEWIHMTIEGIVQGVGFRPAVYRAATRLGLKGTVDNAVDGVHIIVFSSPDNLDRLIALIKKELPPVARIDTIRVSPCPVPIGHCDGFSIIESDISDGRPTDVSPDIAICEECLEDIRRQPRRIGYPLTNCTNCGPRFTIIRALPYDRPSTTMADFTMCPDCRKEYTDPLDRRFHAQPIACNCCGPRYSMLNGDDRIVDYGAIVDRSVDIISRGGILMCKSLGGYNLIANAMDERAITRLRGIKHRPRKPFAIMVSDIATASSIADISTLERETMTGWRRPIVIVKTKDCSTLPDSLAPGCSTLGIMLPYMAFHYDLTERLKTPLVVTSANFIGSPIIIDDNIALDYAVRLDLPVVTFNRDIVNRVDDSVVRAGGNGVRILRRSRGYAPEALKTDSPVDGIIGMGADVTSQWALGRDHDIIMSQYIGSLTEEGGERFLRESIASLTSLFRVSPRIVVTDAHPAYRSSAIGREIAGNAKIIPMYHHHAHAVSVITEYGLTDPVLALILDGTGYGPDGTVWGSELLLCDRVSFKRLDHGVGLAMPGGDTAAKEPWRMGVSLLKNVLGEGDILNALPRRFIDNVGSDRIRFISSMIDRGLNCPITYGAGRMWDAIASLLGLAYFNGYESEAPILLENAATRAYGKIPTYSIELEEMVKSLLADIAKGEEISEIANAFHRSYAEYWINRILYHSGVTGIDRIVLSGGVIQNSLLTDLLHSSLESHGFKVFIPSAVPCGDGGIAVGQIAYAAALENISKRPGDDRQFEYSSKNHKFQYS